MKVYCNWCGSTDTHFLAIECWEENIVGNPEEFSSIAAAEKAGCTPRNELWRCADCDSTNSYEIEAPLEPDTEGFWPFIAVIQKNFVTDAEEFVTLMYGAPDEDTRHTYTHFRNFEEPHFVVYASLMVQAHPTFDLTKVLGYALAFANNLIAELNAE